MKRIHTTIVLLAMLSMVSTLWADTFTLDFESGMTGVNTYFQGVGPTDGADTTKNFTHNHTYKFASDALTVTLSSTWQNLYNDWPEYYPNPSWNWLGGFTISNVSQEDNSFGKLASGKANDNYAYGPTYDSNNIYAAIKGINYDSTVSGGYTLNVGGTANSEGYGIFYGSSALDYSNIGKNAIVFSSPVTIQSFDYTNTATSFVVESFGNFAAQKASEGNWVVAVLRGWDTEGTLLGQKTVPLYDFTNNNSLMVTEWQTANLENFETTFYPREYLGCSEEEYLGLIRDIDEGIEREGLSYLTDMALPGDFGSFENISSLTLAFDGSDAGTWGLNFPTYFALDNLIFSYITENDTPVIPEPSTCVLLLFALLLGLFVQKHP